MKKTEYFTGSQNKNLDVSIDEAKKKRDKFIEDNIAKIDLESIQCNSVASTNIGISYFAIISLTYYPKK